VLEEAGEGEGGGAVEDGVGCYGEGTEETSGEEEGEEG
jgi:hypothetical protein